MQDFSPDAVRLLQEFEDGLDPSSPEGGPLGARILGYGEMSTVFTFSVPLLAGMAFKRMPLFDSQGQATEYLNTYDEYGRVLTKRGLRLPVWGGVRVQGRGELQVLYLTQALLDPQRIAHKVIRSADEPRAVEVFCLVMDAAQVVLSSNNADLSVGLDAQLSNWCLGSSPEDPLVYLDTSTPLIRENGKERLDPELFLKVCPQSLVWIIRRFFLQGVLDRYYDFRLVLLDCIANLNKENRPDLIAPFLVTANERLRLLGLEPLTADQVRSYYREDAFIWRLFLSLRRMERGLRGWTGRRYELILPGPIQR